MNCNRIEELLIESTAHARRSPEVQEHLRSCRSCASLCGELESIGRLSQTLGDTEGAPPGFSSHVFRRAAQTRRSFNPFSTFGAMLSLSAVAALVAVGGGLWSDFTGAARADQDRPPIGYEILGPVHSRPLEPYLSQRPLIRDFDRSPEPLIELTLPDPDHPEGSKVGRLPQVIRIKATRRQTSDARF